MPEPRSRIGAPGRPPESDDPQAAQFRHYSGKVSRQSALFLAGTLFTAFFGYLFRVYVSRQLGAEALGLYALGMATVAMIGTCAYLGLPEMLARFVAAHNATGRGSRVRGLLLRSAKWLLASTGLCALLLFLSRDTIASTLFAAPDLTRFLPLFASLLPLAGLNALAGQYLRGHQEVSRRTLITHFVQFPAKALLTLALFAAGWELTGFVAAEIGSQLLALLLLTLSAARLTPAANGPPGPLETEERAYARYMAIQNLLLFLQNRADLFVVGVLLATDQVGIYSMAVATSAFVPTLLRSTNSIFGPIASDLHARSEAPLLERLFRTTTKWCLGLTWPLVIVLVFFSEVLMGFFGSEFRSGATALSLLALGQLVNVGTGAVGNLLNMSGHQRHEMWASAATAVTILLLDVLWVPRWGLAGAAAAVAIGLALSNLLRLYLVHRFLGLIPYELRALRLLLPMAASGLVTWTAWTTFGSAAHPREWLGLGVAIVSAYSSFLVVAALFALDPDDHLILRAIRHRLTRIAS